MNRQDPSDSPTHICGMMQRKLELDAIRQAEIVSYNKNAASVGEEAQRVDRENRQRLRQEEIMRYSLAPCHHKYA
jgi:hypothetical protein